MHRSFVLYGRCFFWPFDLIQTQLCWIVTFNSPSSPALLLALTPLDFIWIQSHGEYLHGKLPSDVICLISFIPQTSGLH
ncbi:hypothetical protein PITC_098930 [Penicillium italicum]|uniref:Uncharacterized protein n=1 Tax=Penicillium italicum TaxID=40296 RepID=A0A0A2L5R8_PENIT|nr:hypothetical protein PITC_098930 [Penicillium italicum]